MTVPAGQTTGNVYLVTVGGQASNGVSFTVTGPTPTITTLNPNSGAVGTSVIITGTTWGYAGQQHGQVQWHDSNSDKLERHEYHRDCSGGRDHG